MIALGGLALLRPALGDLLDRAPDAGLVEEIRSVAGAVPGVAGTHKCRVRRHGLDYFVDLDVIVDPQMTVKEGHTLAHAVQDAVRGQIPIVSRVLVHLEPADEERHGHD